MSAEGKGNPPFGRQDSGVYSSEPTPSTPQQPQLGQVQPGAGAASVSPLSPIDENHQHPDLDAACLQRSLRQLSREKKAETDAVSVSKVLVRNSDKSLVTHHPIACHNSTCI